MPITSCLYLVGFDFFGIILHGVPASKAGDRADRPYMATAHRQVVGLCRRWAIAFNQAAMGQLPVA